MLQIQVPAREFFDEATSSFVEVGGGVLELEHCLVSLSKWESKFQKPFLSKDAKSPEEILGYVEAMCVQPLEDPAFLQGLTPEHVDEIETYIQSPHSATTFGEMPEKGGPKETVTSELIYYWMVAYNIPWEAERWHLNRLFALIRIANVKNSPPKKMNKAEMARQRAEMNRKRREQLGTSG